MDEFSATPIEFFGKIFEEFDILILKLHRRVKFHEHLSQFLKRRNKVGMDL